MFNIMVLLYLAVSLGQSAFFAYLSLSFSEPYQVIGVNLFSIVVFGAITVIALNALNRYKVTQAPRVEGVVSG